MRYLSLRRPSMNFSTRRSPDALATGNVPGVVEAHDLTMAQAADLTRDPTVQVVARAMPVRLIEPHASPFGPGDGATEDGATWGVRAVGADLAGTSGAGVTVAVLDTGIDASHPAFRGVELIERDFTGGGGGDRQGHGTHCAGTIFGRDVDGVRIGVARGVGRALIGKVLSDDGSGSSEWIFHAMTWAMRERADVISMSLGFDFPGMVESLVMDGWPADLATSNALEAYRGNLRMFDAVMGMLKAQAAFGGSPLVVAAAGNESRRWIDASYRISASLPAAADDVVSVAALGRSVEGYVVAPFSNSSALLAGPGVDVASAWPGGGIRTLSGTSMACPHVAGVAALWSERLRGEGLTPNARTIAARLVASARRDGLAAGLDPVDGGLGMVTSP